MLLNLLPKSKNENKLHKVLRNSKTGKPANQPPAIMEKP